MVSPGWRRCRRSRLNPGPGHPDDRCIRVPDSGASSGFRDYLKQPELDKYCQKKKLPQFKITPKSRAAKVKEDEAKPSPAKRGREAMVVEEATEVPEAVEEKKPAARRGRGAKKAVAEDESTAEPTVEEAKTPAKREQRKLLLRKNQQLR